MSGFTGLQWSWWGVVLVESCPKDSGPGGQQFGFIFILWEIVLSVDLS